MFTITVQYLFLSSSIYRYRCFTSINASAVTCYSALHPTSTSCVGSTEILVIGLLATFTFTSLVSCMESNAKKSPVVSPTKTCPLS